MGTPRRIWSFALLLAIAAGIAIPAWLLLRPREPVYQGKTMSAWVSEEMQQNQTFVVMGTTGALYIAPTAGLPPRMTYMPRNQAFLDLLKDKTPQVLPLLIKALQTPDNRLWKPYQWLQNRLPHVVTRQLPHWPEPRLVRQRGAAIISTLGPAALAAVPAMCETVLHDPDAMTRSFAFRAIHNVGPAATSAVPTLIVILEKDTNAWNRVMAASVLAAFRPPAREIVPSLMKALSDSDVDVRAFVAWALGSLGADATPAIEPLRRIASGATWPTPLVRDGQNDRDIAAAKYALQEIEPSETALIGPLRFPEDVSK
jgi:hypothetical protein